MENISTVLRELRESAKLKQTEVAKIAGVAATTYISWESGAVPKVGAAIKLADHYGVTLDYLYGREPRHIESHTDGLTENEERLINGYRKLTEEQQKAILMATVDLVFRAK